MQKSQSRGGPRPKHVPQRTCITCRRTDTKRGLIRVVRTTEGRVEVDPTGKRNGRGAYLCHDRACWEMALKRRGLERSLRIERILPDDRETLVAFAQHLAPASDDSSQASPQEPERA